MPYLPKLPFRQLLLLTIAGTQGCAASATALIGANPAAGGTAKLAYAYHCQEIKFPVPPDADGKPPQINGFAMNDSGEVVAVVGDTLCTTKRVVVKVGDKLDGAATVLGFGGAPKISNDGKVAYMAKLSVGGAGDYYICCEHQLLFKRVQDFAISDKAVYGLLYDGKTCTVDGKMPLPFPSEDARDAWPVATDLTPTNIVVRRQDGSQTTIPNRIITADKLTSWVQAQHPGGPLIGASSALLGTDFGGAFSVGASYARKDPNPSKVASFWLGMESRAGIGPTLPKDQYTEPRVGVTLYYNLYCEPVFSEFSGPGGNAYWAAFGMVANQVIKGQPTYESSRIWQTDSGSYYLGDGSSFNPSMISKDGHILFMARYKADPLPHPWGKFKLVLFTPAHT